MNVVGWNICKIRAHDFNLWTLYPLARNRWNRERLSIQRRFTPVEVNLRLVYLVAISRPDVTIFSIDFSSHFSPAQ